MQFVYVLQIMSW